MWCAKIITSRTFPRAGSAVNPTAWSIKASTRHRDRLRNISLALQPGSILAIAAVSIGLGLAPGMNITIGIEQGRTIKAQFIGHVRVHRIISDRPIGTIIVTELEILQTGTLLKAKARYDASFCALFAAFAESVHFHRQMS